MEEKGKPEWTSRASVSIPVKSRRNCNSRSEDLLRCLRLTNDALLLVSGCYVIFFNVLSPFLCPKSGKHSLKAAICLAENLPCPYVALSARNHRKGKNRTVVVIYLPHPFLSYLDASKESKAKKRSNGLLYINH